VRVLDAGRTDLHVAPPALAGTVDERVRLGVYYAADRRENPELRPHPKIHQGMSCTLPCWLVALAGWSWSVPGPETAVVGSVQADFRLRDVRASRFCWLIAGAKGFTGIYLHHCP
jgi:hypothetical protein